MSSLVIGLCTRGNNVRKSAQVIGVDGVPGTGSRIRVFHYREGIPVHDAWTKYLDQW